MKPKYLLFASFGLFILIQFLFSLGLAPLADDIIHYADVVKLRNGELTEMDIYRILFNDPNRYERPMSPIILGTMMVLSQYAPFLFFLWGIFFVIPIYLLYKIIIRYYENEWLALLVSILVLFFPLNSTNLFSHVMQSVHFVVFAFILSCYLTYKTELKNYIIIGFLSLCSILFYELNLFIFPILMLLIWNNNQEKKYLKIFLAIIFPTLLALLYKKFGVGIFFEDDHRYVASKILFSTANVKATFFDIFKLFFLDGPYLIFKAFSTIKNYSIIDLFLWIIAGVISIISSLYIQVLYPVKKRNIFIVLLLFALTFIIFFISEHYYPIAFGFENRILLWVRFSSTLLLGVIFYNSLYFTRNKKKLNIGIRVVLSLILLSFFTSVISQKNSYILASDYSKNLIQTLEKTVPNNQENAKIIVVRNNHLRNNFITDERSVKTDWETICAIYLYSNAKFKEGNILTSFNTEDYYLYKIGNIELNKRPKTGYELTENGIKIGEKFFSYPFFIYDERDNSIIKVNNSQEFRIK